MQQKDPSKDILEMAMVIAVNIITVSFIHWVYDGFFPNKSAHVIDISFYAVIVVNLLIYDFTYITKLYSIVKYYDIPWSNKFQRRFELFKIVNVISFVLLSSVVLYGTYLRGSCYGCGPRQSCSKAETDAQNILAALSSYYAEPDRTDVPSIEMLRISENLSLNNEEAEIFGSATGTITVIIADTSKRCPRGNYFITDMGGNVGYWLEEWPVGIQNPFPEVPTHKLKWIPKLVYLIPLIPFFLFFRWYYVSVHH